MKLPPLRRKSLVLVAVLLPLLVLFAWVGLRSGPLAPVPVVVTTHPTTRGAMAKALQSMDRLEALRAPPNVVRIE